MFSNPVADFGELVLLLTLIAACYAGAACAAGARRRSRRLIESGLQATYATAALLTLASSVIFFAIFSNDYSIKYVHHYSDATMPWYYQLTSYWGGLDGSMMFWAWLLALFAALAVYVNRERHRELIPWVATILMGVLVFFLLLLIFAKRPFDVFLTAPPKAGKGLNPLLQDPYMAFHPPSLYIGLVSCAVPFAFGLAALITGQLDDSWLRSVRRWVLVSFFFLSLGLVLGMAWAYHVLGWGGYWGWDPVENAGALAWFTCTAFLHSVMVQERRGMLKVWNVFLVISSFLLTMIATFLTRSGIVQSVHAFGSDPVLKMSFLAFLGVAALLSYGLLLYRLPLLRSRGQLDSWVSREFAFLVNNWILLSAALFILIATLFPTLSETVTGTRINLAAPFYNLWMVPIGLTLLFLTGVGPLIAWRRATPSHLVDQFAVPISAGFVTALVLALIPGLAARTPIFHEKLQLPVALINFSLCAFVLASIGQEFYRGTQVRQTHTQLDFFTSLVGLVVRNKRRYGGYLVHVAIVVMFIGFGGNSYKQETEVTLEAGQQAQLGRYTVRFDGLRTEETIERRSLIADSTVLIGGKELAHVTPAKWYFAHHEEEPVTHVEIRRGPREDLYLTLNGFDAQAKLINLKIVVNPLVNWIWIGFLLLMFGTVLAYAPERALQLAARQAKTAAVGSTAALALWAFTGVPAYADEMHSEAHEVRAAPRSPTENDIFHKIVCMCGTCGRQLLADCTCGTAAKMRDEISQLLSAGKTAEEVIAHYLQKYPGESALAMPIDRGFNRLAWILPYGALLAGIGLLALIASRQRRRTATAPIVPTAPDDLTLGARLDDELDDLD